MDQVEREQYMKNENNEFEVDPFIIQNTFEYTILRFHELVGGKEKMHEEENEVKFEIP